MYTEALKTSSDAAGTLQEQQDIYAESTEAHLQKLSTEAERTYDLLFNTDAINDLADATQNLLSIFNNFLDGLGSSQAILMYFGSIATNIFSKQIAGGIEQAAGNLQVLINNTRGIDIKNQFIDEIEERKNRQGTVTKGNQVERVATEKEADIAKEIYNVRKGLNETQLQELNMIQGKLGDLAKEKELLKQNNKEYQKILELTEKIKNNSFSNKDSSEKEFVDKVSQIYGTNFLSDLVKEDFGSTDSYSKYFEQGELLADRRKAIDSFNNRRENKSNPITITNSTGAALKQLVDSQIISMNEEGLEDFFNLNDLNQQKIILEQIKAEIEEATKELEEQEAVHLRITRAVKEQENLFENEAQTKAFEDAKGKAIKDAEKNLKIQNAITIASAATTALVGVAGSLPTIFDDTASEVDKFNAKTSLATSLVTSISSLIPGWGPLIATAGTAILNLFTGAQREIAEKTDEAIKETREAWEGLSNEIQNFKNQITSLEDLKEEFNLLSLGVSEYGDNISLTADEFNRYHDIVNDIAELTPDLVKGYDEEGNAIINNNNLIEESIRLLKEEQLEKKKSLVTSDKLEYAFEDVKTNIAKAEKKYNNAYVDYNGATIASDFSNQLNELPLETIKYLEEYYDGEVPTYAELIKNINIDNFIKELESDNINLQDTGIQQLLSILREGKEAYVNATLEIAEASKGIDLARQGMTQKFLTMLEVGDTTSDTYAGLNNKEKTILTSLLNTFKFTKDSTEEDQKEAERLAEEWLEKISGLNETQVFQLEQLTDASNFNTYSAYLDARNAAIEEFAGTGIDVAAMTPVLDENIDTLLKIFEEQYKGKLGGQSLFEIFTLDELQNADFKNNIIGGIDFDTVENEHELNHLRNLAEQAKEYANNLSQARASLTTVQSALTTFQEEGKLSTSTIEGLKNKYEELAEIQDGNSHEFIERLRMIGEIEEANILNTLKAERDLKQLRVNEATAKLLDGKATADEIELVNNALKELTEAEHQIQLQIQADITSDIDNAFGLADEFTRLQELVSEDLTVTYEEAQELIANGYGAILENATKTAEQEIMLDKAVMNNYIDNRQKELEESKQVRIQELQDERAVLVAQRDALNDKLEALKAAKVAENAIDAEAALQKARDAEATYQLQVDELNKVLDAETDFVKGEEEINQQLYTSLGGMYEDNSLNAQEASITAAEVAISSIESEYNAVVKLHEAYRKLAIQKNSNKDEGAIPGFSEGDEEISPPKPIIPTSSEIKKSKIDATIRPTEEAVDFETYFKNYQKEYRATIDAIIKQTQAQLDSLNSEIGGIDAAIAALQSAGLALDTAQDGASIGETLEVLEDILDVYHDINLELKNYSNQLDKLQKQQDKLVGQDLFNNLNEQLSLLNKQTDAYNEKLAIATIQAVNYKSQLSDLGATFDEDGYLTNYSELLLNKLNEVNNATSEEEQKRLEKEYEDLKKLIENYDETISSTIPEIQAAIQDTLNEAIELQIQKFTYEVELKLDISEAEKEWNEFKRNVLEDFESDALKEATIGLDNIETYFGEGSIEALTDQVNNTLAELKKMDETGLSDVYGDNRAQALEDLKTYYTELMGQLEGVKNLQEEVQQAYLDSIDEASAAFDEQMKQYDYINDLYNHDMNLIGLLYGDDAYEEMSKYYDAIAKNNEQQVDFAKKRVDYFKEQMDAETDPEARKKWQEEWQKALTELNSTVEASVENIIAQYKNTINLAFEELNDKVTNGKGLNFIKEEWDLAKKSADQYLDTVNAAFEIQNLENKYIDALNKTDSISAQQKINDLMAEQLSMLETKEKLTQYDIDRANALLDIQLKEIALQEAQQNKTKMRLRRDSQGNYTYQYVSDEDAISAAQQELNEARNNLYNMDKEAYQNNLDEVYELYVEFEEKVKELYLDNTLSEEERQQKKKLLTEQYGNLINNIIAENEVIRQNLTESTFDALSLKLENFSELEQKTMMEEIVPNWNNGIQEMINAFIKEDGFEQTCSATFDKLELAADDYAGAIERIGEKAGIALGDSGLGGHLSTIEGATESLIQDNDSLLGQYSDLVDAVELVKKQVDELVKSYEDAKTAAEEATKAAYDYWVQEQKASAKDNDSGSKGNGSGSGGKGPSSSGSNPNKENENDSGGKKVPEKDNGGDNKTSAYYNITQLSNGLWSGKGSDGGHVNTLVSLSAIKKYGEKYYDYYVVDGGAMQKFLSGGYTGNWSNGDKEGRLALLHQKELVLNAKDTENILSAVSIIRDMDSLINNLNNSIMERMLEKLNVPNLVSKIVNNAQSLEQQVHIEANFPGVRDASEIEEAFNNLVNIASQRALNTLR